MITEKLSIKCTSSSNYYFIFYFHVLFAKIFNYSIVFIEIINFPRHHYLSSISVGNMDILWRFLFLYLCVINFSACFSSSVKSTVHVNEETKDGTTSSLFYHYDFCLLHILY